MLSGKQSLWQVLLDVVTCTREVCGMHGLVEKNQAEGRFGCSSKQSAALFQ